MRSMPGTVTSCPRCGAESQEDWAFCPHCAMALDTASFDLDAFSDRIRYVRREAENRTRRNVVLRTLPNMVWGVVVLVVVGGGVLLFHPRMVPSLFEPQEISLNTREEAPAVGALTESPALASQAAVPFEWIEIPEGEFSVGPTPGESDPPLPRVYLPAFAILKYEVTNEQWYQYLVSEKDRLQKLRRFDKAIPRHWKAEPGVGVPLPSADLWEKPVVFISWEQAQDFCENWLAHRPGYSGARLPTSLEWEKAARGPDDERRYPWGYTFTFYDSISGTEVLQCNVQESGNAKPVGVGDFAATDVSYYGVVGMGGNVAEFVGDGSSQGYRGGTFNTDEFYARIYDESPVTPNAGFTWSHVGFRAARSLTR
jgi:formylglycine-generating enzyme required for sulfatase activity